MTAKSNAPPGLPGGAGIESGLAAAQFDELDNKPGSDLLQEFAASAAKAAQPETVAWLARYGIGRGVIFGPHCSLVGVARIEIDGQYYQPVPEGHPAIIIPVSYDYAPGCLDPLDLIAFTPARPDRWYHRTGWGDVLGEDAIERAWLLEQPLTMHATPLDWLQAGGHGTCILDWSAARFALGNVRAFNCPTREYGLKLQRALSEPVQPVDIRIPEACHAA